MKNKPKVSVTISTLNAPDTLFKALAGYFNQSTKPLEVVVVCTPKNANRIRDFVKAKKQSNFVKIIKFIGDKNDARNIGFLNAKGDYIIYADEDMVPRKDLIERCLMNIDKYDAMIIPEEGIKGKSLLSRIHRLEKEIVKNDVNALTPRLFKKTLFNQKDLPFDKKFGVLDEWGFNLKLISKNPKIGNVESKYIVSDYLSLVKRVKKNYKKGLSVKDLLNENRDEALRRVNPMERGIRFYSSNIKYLKDYPLIFPLFIAIKFLDMASLTTGYFLSFTLNKKSPNLN